MNDKKISNQSIEVALFIDMQSKQLPNARPRTTVGQIQQMGNSLYLSYLEDEAEMGQTSTRIKYEIGVEDGFTLIRNGTVSMRQSYIPGTVTSGRYESPYGVFHMETETKHASFRWNGVTGEVKLDYRLHMNGEDLGRFRLQIRFEKA